MICILVFYKIRLGIYSGHDSISSTDMITLTFYHSNTVFGLKKKFWLHIKPNSEIFN